MSPDGRRTEWVKNTIRADTRWRLPRKHAKHRRWCRIGGLQPIRRTDGDEFATKPLAPRASLAGNITLDLYTICQKCSPPNLCLEIMDVDSFLPVNEYSEIASPQSLARSSPKQDRAMPRPGWPCQEARHLPSFHPQGAWLLGVSLIFLQVCSSRRNHHDSGLVSLVLARLPRNRNVDLRRPCSLGDKTLCRLIFPLSFPFP